MKPLRYNLLVPPKPPRWVVAQNAEKRGFRCKNNKLQFKANFFLQNFMLTSEFFKNKSVLEIGCSSEASIHSIEGALFKVGVEPLASQWRFFYRKNTSMFTAIGEYLPFNDNTFDIILCINVLDHVQFPPIVLNEIKRCLKKKGVLVLWLQTFSTIELIKKILNAVDKPHPHHFDDNTIALMLQQVGYNIHCHMFRKAVFTESFSLIKENLYVSGLKSMFAKMFFGLSESSFVCSKTD